MGPNISPKHIYSDNGNDIVAGVTRAGWAGVHDKSTPNRHETNGVVERCNQRTEIAASVGICQSGLHPCWWAEAIDCQLFVHRAIDQLRDGRTPYEQRWNGQKYDGPVFPFGAQIEYKRSSKKGQMKLPNIGKKTLEGTFRGLLTDVR